MYVLVMFSLEKTLNKIGYVHTTIRSYYNNNAIVVCLWFERNA